MSATIRGFGFNEVKPQPGFTATKSKEGGWTGSHSFAIKRIAWNNASVRGQFAQGTAITELDPDLPSYWNFMKIVEPRVTSEEGDIIIVETTIAGGEGAQYGDGDELADGIVPSYRLNGQLQEFPLSQHPRWVALTALQKEALAGMIDGGIFLNYATDVFGYRDESQNFYPFSAYSGIATGDCLAFAKLIAEGTTTYLKPVFTWTESTQGDGPLTGAQINKLGRISNPRGNPPEPNGTRDWMLTSAFQEERGDLYTTDLEWTLSERGGHNQLLYAEDEE
jgi:hypothetical protein